MPRLEVYRSQDGSPRMRVRHALGDPSQPGSVATPMVAQPRLAVARPKVAPRPLPAAKTPVAAPRPSPAPGPTQDASDPVHRFILKRDSNPESPTYEMPSYFGTRDQYESRPKNANLYESHREAAFHANRSPVPAYPGHTPSPWSPRANYARLRSRLVRYEARHAPRNGIVIAGFKFEGGEFVPNAAFAQATPQQKALLTHPKGMFKPKLTPKPGVLSGKASNLKSAAANPGKGHGVGFVSPETGEGLGLSEATVRVYRGKQQHFMSLAKDIDRTLRMQSSVDPGIGTWAPSGQTPGAEPTTVATYRSAPDFAAIRYATACKGYAANQHSALAFGSHPQGPDYLWSMMVASELSGIGDVLKEHGIEYHTIRLSNGGKHDVMIYDQGGQLHDKVKAAAEALGVSRPAYRRGQGEFLGGDGSDRKQARKKFRHIMRTYEKKYPDRPHYEWQRNDGESKVRMAEADSPPDRQPPWRAADAPPIPSLGQYLDQRKPPDPTRGSWPKVKPGKNGYIAPPRGTEERS